jgi:hypothetical protein
MLRFAKFASWTRLSIWKWLVKKNGLGLYFASSLNVRGTTFCFHIFVRGSTSAIDSRKIMCVVRYTHSGQVERMYSMDFTYGVYTIFLIGLMSVSSTGPLFTKPAAIRAVSLDRV